MKSLFLSELKQIIEDCPPRQFNSILEWGAGKSTVLFHEAAVKNNSEIFITVDHHEEYLISVIENLNKTGFLRPHAVPLSELWRYRLPDNNVCFYSSCPMHYRRLFDIIFVDGRTRNECLISAAFLASPKAIIILHDFRRVRMTPAKYLFDEVETNFRGVLLLRRKDSLEPFFANFLEDELLTLKEAPKIAVYSTAKNNKEEDDLSEDDTKNLKRVIKKYIHRGCQKIVEWGTPASTALILKYSKKFSPNHYLNIKLSRKSHDEIMRYRGKYPFFDPKAVSLEGMREHGSREPNYHYSSCPIYFRKKFNFFYVGSERRNECLLTAALLLEKKGIVILREGDLFHYAPGKYFFETIDRIGTFHVLKRKPILDGVFGSFLDNLPENTKNADIDPAR